MGGALKVRPATSGDAAAIAAIYAHYVRTGVVTFEIEPPDNAEMATRIGHILPHHPFIVAERDGAVVGYAYASKLYERAAYRWTAEATVYVASGQHRQGIGRDLYRALIAALAEQGFQAVVGKITLPNPASISLHESFGFVRCGVFARVGFKHGTWHDVGLYQLDIGTHPSMPAETRPFTR